MHDREFAQSFIDGSISATQMRRIGLPWSQTLVQRTLVGTGRFFAFDPQMNASVPGGTMLALITLGNMGVKRRRSQRRHAKYPDAV